MQGYLILNGGDGFSPLCKNANHLWLQIIRRQNRPRLVVIPTATLVKPRQLADQTMRYFNHLGTFAEYTMIEDTLSANTAANYDIINKVDAIVLTDGSPIDLVERVRGTHTEKALRSAVTERSAALMATGASAMAIGAVYWMSGVWEQGLGIAANLAIIPQHSTARMRLSPERLLDDLPDGITIIGIDEATHLFCFPDGHYEVHGEGEVTVYRNVEEQESFLPGGQFTLGDA